MPQNKNPRPSTGRGRTFLVPQVDAVIEQPLLRLRTSMLTYIVLDTSLCVACC